jgi:hypothetical protein
MTMPASENDKKEAIKRLDGLKNFQNFKQRATELINNPAGIDQDQFGVCGMISTMYVMLIHHPGVFVDLLYAIFNDTAFPGFKEQMKKEGKGRLLYEREKEFNNKAAVNQYVKAGTKLDFVVSRTLGRFLMMASPDQYKKQVDFMAQILGSEDEAKKREKQGDLALTEQGLMLLLADVLQIESGSYIPPVDAATLVGKVNEWHSQDSKKNPFVIAAVNKPSEWISKGKVPTGPFQKTGAADFSHWVVITGKSTDKNGKYQIPIWTWSKNFNTELDQRYTTGYLYSLVRGCAVLT